jgi:hypothetical protein
MRAPNYGALSAPRAPEFHIAGGNLFIAGVANLHKINSKRKKARIR